MNSQKKKPGPKPKAKPLVIPIPQTVPFQAVESTELPLTRIEVKRIVVHKLTISTTEYFIEKNNNKLYTSLNGKPGVFCGYWNRENQTIEESEELSFD